MRAKKSRRRQKQTAEDRRYLAWLHTQPCAGMGFEYGSFSVHDCEPRHWLNPLQASHFRDHTGASLKEPDATAIPLCKYMHDAYDGRLPQAGVFDHLTFDERKDWHRARQKEVRARYLSGLSEAGGR